MDKNVTVSKANQAILTTSGASTLPNLTKDSGDYLFGGNIHAVNTSTNTPSGLAVSFTSSQPGIVQVVSGGTTVVGGGTAVITAAQAGNEGFNAALVQAIHCYCY